MEDVKVVVNGQELTVSREVYDKAIVDKKLEIKDENLLLFSKADYETRLKNEKDAEYKKGRTDENEILVKETKRKLGLEFEGKDIDMLMSAFKSKIEKDLNVEPDKKVSELSRTIDTLRENLRIEAEKNNNIVKDFQVKEEKNRLESSIHSAIPEKAVNESFSRNDIAAMFRANGYSNELVDGKEVVKLNGEIVKNKVTLEPLTVKEIMADFVTAKKLITKEGRSGTDEIDTAKAGTLQGFMKEMEAKGYKYGSIEYNREMTERIKNKTLAV